MAGVPESLRALKRTRPNREGCRMTWMEFKYLIDTGCVLVSLAFVLSFATNRQ